MLAWIPQGNRQRVTSITHAKAVSSCENILMHTTSTALLLTLALLAAFGAGLAAQKAVPDAMQASQPGEDMLVWPPPPAPARVKWVAEYRNAFDVGARKRRPFLDRLAGKTEEVLWLDRPQSVAVDEKGVIFVGDFTRGIVAMDPARKAIWEFSSVSGFPLPTPTGLAVDSRLVYATSANTDQVVVFDKKGHQLGALGKSDGIHRPVGVAVDEGRNLLIIVNGQEHAVRLYTRTLQLIKTVGERGGEEGQFNMPSYVCILPGVGFAVVDTGNFRIQIFDFNGQFLRTFGKVGDLPCEFARPKGIAVDPDGHLYVVDGTLNKIQVFDQEGHILTQVGRVGTQKGQFQVPNGLAIDAKGAIYVADQLNRRIQKFQYLPEEKTTPASTAH